jgi:hypothetical protein
VIDRGGDKTVSARGVLGKTHGVAINVIANRIKASKISR